MFFARGVLVFVLLLPGYSLAKGTPLIEGNKPAKIYFSASCAPSILKNTSFSIHESGKPNNKVLSLSRELLSTKVTNIGAFSVENRKLRLENSTLPQLSGTLGLISERKIGVGLSINYKKLQVSSSGYQNPSVARIWALTTTTKKQNDFVTVEVPVVHTSTLIADICHEHLSYKPKIPGYYVCMGGGGTFVGVTNSLSFRPSYRAKGGLIFPLNGGFSVVAGAFHQEVLGSNEYKDLPVSYPIASSKVSAGATASMKLSHSGIELGLRYDL